MPIFNKKNTKLDKVFLVPKAYTDLTTKNILVTEYIEGLPFDMCKNLNQEEHNYVIKAF